jgi:hypothetical protein
MIEIELWGEGDNNSNNKNISILFILNKMKELMPEWLRIIFILLTLIFIILKLLGYNIIQVLIDDTLLKNFVCVYCVVVINYHLLIIYLIHKFSTKKIQIPEVLPNFMINWLKNFEIMSETKETIKAFTKNSYIEISLYMIILLLVLLFF